MVAIATPPSVDKLKAAVKCEMCGKKRKLEAHQQWGVDFWFCKPCHVDLHLAILWISSAGGIKPT